MLRHSCTVKLQKTQKQYEEEWPQGRGVIEGPGRTSMGAAEPCRTPRLAAHSLCHAHVSQAGPYVSCQQHVAAGCDDGTARKEMQSAQQTAASFSCPASRATPRLPAALRGNCFVVDVNLLLRKLTPT